ncbi:MAG: hypothetical protein M5U01_27855 [Ardenticatenaceae bacterium]|nr:hypothetical protein [Ardenticatenaceae bacterium]
MEPRWYVLHTKPHKEAIVWQQVQAYGLESYYPRIQVQPVNPRSRTVRPYFPGYLFVRADLDAVRLSTLQWMPAAIGLVSFGGQPAVVPDELIAAIRRHVRDVIGAGGELFYGLEPGDPVEIRDGLFAGYEAIFDARLSATDRVRVLLKMLSHRYVAVELRAGQLKRCGA